MSLRSTARAFPALLKVGVSEMVAYRAEMFVWVLSTTMPLVMLAMWSAVASEAPVGRFGQTEFTAYFLVTFIVRQLTGSWAAWEMNYEVRSGRLSQRLLRPVHPLATYTAENMGAFPLRVAISLPVVGIILYVVGRSAFASDWRMYLLMPFSVFGGWLIAIFVNLAIGSMSLFMESSLKVLDVWFTMFMAFSGYLVPIELFPGWLKAIVEWLPWRYMIGFPVEVITGGIPLQTALWRLAAQWTWVAIMLGAALLLWKRGLKNFSAYGG